LSEALADMVSDAVESTRAEVGLPEETELAPLASPFPPFFLPDGAPPSDGPAQWAEALDEASEAGSDELKYRFAVHAKVASGLAGIAQAFFDEALEMHTGGAPFNRAAAAAAVLVAAAHAQTRSRSLSPHHRLDSRRS
jgi:hypothetical protein